MTKTSNLKRSVTLAVLLGVTALITGCQSVKDNRKEQTKEIKLLKEVHKAENKYLRAKDTAKVASVANIAAIANVAKTKDELKKKKQEWEEFINK